MKHGKRSWNLLVKITFGLFIMFFVWTVSGIFAANLDIPNLVAKKQGFNCLCDPSIVEVLNVYVTLAGIDINVFILAPMLIFGITLIPLRILRKHKFTDGIGKIVSIAIIVSILGIAIVLVSAYTSGIIGPAKQSFMDIEIEMTDGQVLTLSYFKGKPILLELMHPGCPYCSLQADELRKLIDKYGDRLVFISVSVSPYYSMEDLIEFNKLHNVTWLSGLEPSGRLINALDLRGVPQTVLIDRDGNIFRVYRGLASADLIESGILELLSQ